MNKIKNKILFTLAIIVICQLSTVDSLMAQTPIRPKIACPGGIMINSYNGQLFFNRTDISIPNHDDFPLEAVFYYNSSNNDVDYGFGKGWSLGYGYRYEIEEDGIVIIDGDGRRDKYLGSPHDSYHFSSAGLNSSVGKSLADNSTAIGTGFVLHTQPAGAMNDHIQYCFNDTVSQGLTRIVHHARITILMSYNDEGKLATMSDASGRTLFFSWANGHMVTLSTNIDDRQWHYTYDDYGNLVAVENPLGAQYTVRYGYDDDHHLNQIVDEEGYETRIYYNGEGMAYRVWTDVTDRVIRYDQGIADNAQVQSDDQVDNPSLSGTKTVVVDYLDDEHSQFTTYVWDEKGRVVEKTGNCCGYTTKTTYDNYNKVTKIVDASGNSVNYTYTDGVLSGISDQYGSKSISYQEHQEDNGEPSVYMWLTDNTGKRYCYIYDNHDNLTRVNNPAGFNGPGGWRNLYEYNDYGQVVKGTDALGNEINYHYDDYGNMDWMEDAMGKKTRYSYNSTGLVTEITTPEGNKWQGSYDALGQLIWEIDPAGNRTTYTYDRRGLVTGVRNALGDEIRMQYDAIGNCTAITNPMGGVKRIRYNAMSLPVEVTEPNGSVIRLEYDDHNKMVKSTDATGHETHYTYDALGNLTGVVTPGGRELTYAYDGRSRLTQIADQSGIIRTYTYDASNNVTKITDALGHETQYSYDIFGNRTSVTDALGHTTQYTYDLLGRLLSYTDADGNSYTYEYDNGGHLTTLTDPLGNKTRYSYNDDGKLKKIKDANGNSTQYEYNSYGLCSRVTFANGKTQQFSYNLRGNITQYTDEMGNRLSMSYDRMGRVTRISYPDGSSDNYTYDAMGNLLTANNANANVSFTYDAAGRCLSEQMTITGRPAKTTSFEYDIPGRRNNITYPGGRRVQKQFDVRGRLSHVYQGTNDEQVVHLVYHPNDLLAATYYANGDANTYFYDDAGHLTYVGSQNDNHNTQISSLNLAYSPSGHLTSVTDNINPSWSETYSFDALQRLTNYKRGNISSGTIANPTHQVQYNLDALGNRTSVVTDGVTTNYSHNNMNAYTSVGGTSRQYDLRGNLISDGQHTYQYNYTNHLVSVDYGATATYKYDALGRCVSKTTPAGTVYYYYDWLQNIEEEGTQNATYIYGFNRGDILTSTRGSQEYYYHKNQTGSVTSVSGDDGVVAESYTYEPYGETTVHYPSGGSSSSSHIGNSHTYNGQKYDDKSNSYNDNGRDYNSGDGRNNQPNPPTWPDDVTTNDPDAYDPPQDPVTPDPNDNYNPDSPQDPEGEPVPRMTTPGTPPGMHPGDTYGPPYRPSSPSWPSRPSRRRPNPGTVCVQTPQEPSDTQSGDDERTGWCNEHPIACSMIPPVNFSGCFFAGLGGCLDISLDFTKKNPFDAHATVGFGWEASAEVNTTSLRDGSSPSFGDFDFGAGAGPFGFRHQGGNNQLGVLTGTAGYDSKGGAYGGARFGVGGGGHAGITLF